MNRGVGSGKDTGASRVEATDWHFGTPLAVKPSAHALADGLGPGVTVECVRASELATRKWAGGTTTQLAIFPNTANYEDKDFTARVSTAVISERAPFSRLEGFKRILMVLSGDGVRLNFDNRTSCTVRNLYEKTAFDGGLGANAELLGDSVRDFNLMLGKGADGDLFVYEIGRGDFTFELPGVSRDLVQRGDAKRVVNIFYTLDGESSCSIPGENAALSLKEGDIIKIDQPVTGRAQSELKIRSSTPRAHVVVARLWFSESEERKQ